MLLSNVRNMSFIKVSYLNSSIKRNLEQKKGVFVCIQTYTLVCPNFRTRWWILSTNQPTSTVCPFPIASRTSPMAWALAISISKFDLLDPFRHLDMTKPPNLVNLWQKYSTQFQGKYTGKLTGSSCSYLRCWPWSDRSTSKRIDLLPLKLIIIKAYEQIFLIISGKYLLEKWSNCQTTSRTSTLLPAAINGSKCIYPASTLWVGVLPGTNRKLKKAWNLKLARRTMSHQTGVKIIEKMVNTRNITYY